MSIDTLYDAFVKSPKISTDTRKIVPGSIFFALRGANFNGNEYAEQALALGAVHAVIDDISYKKDDRYILVENVLEALQQLAEHHRSKLNIPIIGITGTNGKTTTKELLHAVLSVKFKTYATKGNLNNHIGVPLSILDITSDIEIAIIEMGANHVGEIAFLCEIAKPTLGLITNVGKAHLEGFGSFDGVKRAKGELYDWLEKSGGVLFLQADNNLLLNMANNRSFKEIITYGYNQGNHISGNLVSSNPTIALLWSSMKANGCKEEKVQTNLTGSYNMENVLAAIAVGLHFSLNCDEVHKGLISYMPTNNRSQISETANNTVICDYYNANASSMSAALENLENLTADNKAVILGDMFELGKESATEHNRIVQLVNAMHLNRKIFIGHEFYEQRDNVEHDDSEFYNSADEAIQALKKMPLKGSLVLLKASRGMAFEKLVAFL
ncbi:UDP-N-acetylmuramoyl-tripeptide--D-alanyl-D-alanine ligase [Olivibacter domesticus]|uniref:UDP-N-acetylmuramoyl-tripeptide--D-alanyl-D-alanine ligase n=1 Tax=Olivibacter domesticus TaxID=407022 RepID=A0A1H7S2E4_OLID1|nr:UDP-N-acetylmuramoyl-tripeptide--D-alanyl-D-alanine ligase [Olivibacter domesticus]SEL66486.1 UDP-N-acetylmuramoyl-tripeptide--D-alanyl-D-alanine ligase [Olivibacter domesticus]